MKTYIEDLIDSIQRNKDAILKNIKEAFGKRLMIPMDRSHGKA
jgi:hypothetical protein